MANISKIKRDRMLAFLEELKMQHNDDESIRAFNEIENHIREKKYGLVWEEHSEQVDEMLEENIPVFCEDPERKICKDPSLPYNFIIEGDNLQALYLLEKTHRGKIDCIYIDPPYNTGARDWKYNNDYVDSNDVYRHSKWLSLMNVRLKLAKQILNPDTGVLIVTIDEHEVHHLLSLLEELFPQAYIQMVTIVVNPKGSTRDYFSRVEEYAIYCFMPKARVNIGNDPMLGERVNSKTPRWKGLLRSGEGARREDSKSLFYPILIDSECGKIIRAGAVVPYPQKPKYDEKIDGYDVAWPIRNDMSEGRWMLSVETFNSMLEKGYISLGKYDKKRKTWGISYLSKKPQKQIETGELVIIGRDPITGTVKVEYAASQEKQIKTVWHRTLHDAGAYGSDLVSNIIGTSRAFSFPKSIYAERDSLSAAVKNNPNAIILDFFAGSGTTLHAVNLLNLEDNGTRRCIMVTNNELSEKEAADLSKKGYKPGDVEWEAKGIAKAVTWPRTKFSINGYRDDNSQLEGEYYTNIVKEVQKSRNIVHISYIRNPMDLKIQQKKQLISILTKGTLPQTLIKKDSKYVLSKSERHTSSVLLDEEAVEEWINELEGMNHITNFYILTENNEVFKSIKERLVNEFGNIIVQEQEKYLMQNGFKANVKYLKCDWTPRKPEDYLLSNMLCLHIKEMIELQNGYEIDGVKNVLILTKDDFSKAILDASIYEQIENVWLNQNMILTAKEMKLLKAKDFKYIPKEFFGRELREAAE